MSGVEEKWMSDLDSTGLLYVKFAYPIIKYMKNFKFQVQIEKKGICRKLYINKNIIFL